MVSRLSLKAKLAGGFGALLVILITMGIISFTSVQKLSDLSAFGDEKANGRFLSVSIESGINNQKAEYRAFLLTDEEGEMSRYAENSRALADNFDKLEATLSTEKGKAMVAHLRQVLNEYHGIVDRAVALHRAGKQKQAIEAITDPKADMARAELNKTIADLVALQQKLKDSSRADLEAAQSRTTLLISGLAIVGVVVGVIVALIIVRSITGGISRMVAMIEEIAANNLTVD